MQNRLLSYLLTERTDFPNDQQVEKKLLGAMLCGLAAAVQALRLIEGEAFYLASHRRLFMVFFDLAALDRDWDFEEITAECQRRGHAEWTLLSISELVECTEGESKIPSYCRVLNRLAGQRKAMTEAIRIVQDPPEPEILEAPDNIKTMNAELADEKAGVRYSVNWPWPTLNRTLALLPGSITLLCGSPGASKSLWLLECLWRWVLSDCRAVIFEMEKGSAFHFRRAFAQIAENSSLLNPEWCRVNFDAVQGIYYQYEEMLRKIQNAVKAPGPGNPCTFSNLLRMIHEQAEEGARVIAIDPISKMGGQNARFLDQERFMDQAEKLAQKHKFSLILVIHPKGLPGGTKTTPMLENIQGSRAFERFADNIFWLHSHDDLESTISDPPQVLATHNRTLHLLKVRNGPGAGKRIAFAMDYRNLWHVCHGEIA